MNNHEYFELAYILGTLVHLLNPDSGMGSEKWANEVDETSERARLFLEEMKPKDE